MGGTLKYIRKGLVAAIGLLTYLASSGPLTALSIWFLHATGSGLPYAALLLFYMPLYVLDDMMMGGYGEGPYGTYTQWCMKIIGTGPP